MGNPKQNTAADSKTVDAIAAAVKAEKATAAANAAEAKDAAAAAKAEKPAKKGIVDYTEAPAKVVKEAKSAEVEISATCKMVNYT